MLSFVWTAIVGIIVGAIARWIMPGSGAGGLLVTMLIGITGAFIARFVGENVFHWYKDGSTPGWIASILGAMLLLWLWRQVNGGRA